MQDPLMISLPQLLKRWGLGRPSTKDVLSAHGVEPVKGPRKSMYWMKDIERIEQSRAPSCVDDV